jgi:hypothetical protein
MTIKLSGLPAAEAWLEQFSSGERQVAEQLLDGLVLVSASSFHKSLMELMESVVLTNGPSAFYAARELADRAKYFPNNNAKPAAVPYSAVGSEGVAAQIINRLAAAEHDALDHPPIKTLRSRRVHNLVLVDDICASGKRVADFLLGFMTNSSLRSWASYGKLTIHVLAYAVSREAEATIAKTLGRWTRISREKRLRFHMVRPLISAYEIFDETLLKQVQALCDKYPPTLPPPHAGARRGYRKTMAITVFQHGCPNNVPAMLWTTAAGWSPIFPNRQIPTSLVPAFMVPPKLDRSRRLSSILSANDEENHNDRLDLVRVLNALRRRKLDEEELVHATGLGTLSVRLVLKECVRFGLVSQVDGRTTRKGKAELQRLRRRTPAEIALVSDDQPVYIPGALRGSRDSV